MPDNVLPDLWAYSLFVDPLSCRVIVVQQDTGTPSPERIIDLTLALSALPLKPNCTVEILADTGEMLVLRPQGELRQTLKFDDTYFYQL